MKSLDAVGAAGGSGDRHRSTPEGVERRAIAEIFGLVDVDASGRVSEDELLETVRNQPQPQYFYFYLVQQ